MNCGSAVQCYSVQAKKTAPRADRPPKRKAATAQDVLGTQPTSPPIPAKWKGHYARLDALRDQLLNKKGDLAEDARQEIPTFSMHMADAGTDTYDRDWALSMLSSEQNAVYEIEAAMERIRNGTYGTCEISGKRIEPERLEAIPWTRFSADAERELERTGAANRTRLGELGSAAAISRSEEKQSAREEDQI